MANLVSALLLGIASASARLAARWPAEPVADEDSSLFRQLQAKLGAKVEAILGTSLHARALAEAPANSPPSLEDIAQYNIILFVSIAIVLIFYFASMALVNMEHMNDSLLYSKSKTD